MSDPDPRADHRSQVRDFLVSRRERITPERAGLPAYGGGNRRVKGLRREEVALLAGVSTDYYVRMERGNLTGASQAVLDGVASALQLDEAEHEHLLALARAAGCSGSAPRRMRPAATVVGPVVQQVLDAITDAPAWVRNARHDILAANPLALALYSPMLISAVAGPTSRRPANVTRFVFVGELSTQSDLFRRHWASNNVKFHRSGRKRLRHPGVGELDLNYESMQLSSDANLRLNIYTADPDTPTADGLRLLSTWAATTGNESPVLRGPNIGEGSKR